MYENYSEAIDGYDEYLNEFHSALEVAGIVWDPADVLRNMDPIAYRVGFFDWLDGEGIDSDDLNDEGYNELP